MNDKKKEAIQNLNEIQDELFNGIESGIKLRKIADTHNLSEDTNYDLFTEVVGDVILGLSAQEKLPKLLIEKMKVTQADAMRITADVLDFLEPLNDVHSSTTYTSTDTPTPTEAKIPTPPQPAQESLAAELAATEAAFKELQPIRTMAHDMETLRTDDTPTYKAADQETILNGQGNAEKNTKARWETPEK